jgi:hypothetical protein
MPYTPEVIALIGQTKDEIRLGLKKLGKLCELYAEELDQVKSMPCLRFLDVIVQMIDDAVEIETQCCQLMTFIKQAEKK